MRTRRRRTRPKRPSTEEVFSLAKELHGWLRACNPGGCTCLYCRTEAAHYLVVVLPSPEEP